MWGFGFIPKRFFTVSSNVPNDLVLFDSAISQARLKVNRANRHIKDVQAVLESFVQSDFCRLVENIDPDTGDQSFSVVASQVPADLPLSIGDCFHNLSSALDYISSAVMRIKAGSTGRTTFPSHESRKALKASFKRPKPGKGTPPNRGIVEACPVFALTLLCKIKPYRGGGSFAWEVRRADNIDKHNLFIPTIYVAALHDVYIVDTDRNNKVHFSEISVGPGGQCDALRYVGGTAKVENYGQASFAVTFPEDAEVFAGNPVVPTLLQCAQGIEEVVNLCDTHLRTAFSSI